MADDLYDNIKVQFEQFLSTVGDILYHEKEIHLIKNKIRRHFNKTSPSYVCSTDFRLLLSHIHDSFNENNKSTKFFKLLNSFDEQLRKHNIKTTISTDDNIELTSCTSSHTIPIKSSSLITSTNAQSSATCNEPSLPITIEESHYRMTTDSDMEMKRKNKIKKLEHRLNNLSKIIRELEEKELSLDEMQYSDLYQVESKLKQQAYDIYTKLADLKNQSSSIERILDQPVNLIDAEIDHPLINKALEDMVNQTKYLPSFNEVLDIVEKTNDKYELDLGVDARKTIAEKGFKIIGTKVKDRRMADFNDIMNSRLPENFDIEQNDPALNSIEIENTLLKNEREAEIKTQKIFEEFSQINTDLEPEINIESSEESTVENDEDVDEDNNDADAESESDTNVNSHKDTPIQYDIVDMLPPFSPESVSSPPSNTTETIHNKDSVEISLHERTLKILSKISIPVKRTAQKSFPEVLTIPDDDDDAEESQPISIIQQHTVHTIIPRRRQQSSSTTTTDSSTSPKRSIENTESSKSKKLKEPTEVVILD